LDRDRDAIGGRRRLDQPSHLGVRLESVDPGISARVRDGQSMEPQIGADVPEHLARAQMDANRVQYLLFIVAVAQHDGVDIFARIELETDTMLGLQLQAPAPADQGVKAR